MAVMVACELQSVELKSVALEIERQSAQLFHLKAGLNRIQSEVDRLIDVLGALDARHGRGDDAAHTSGLALEPDPEPLHTSLIDTDVVEFPEPDDDVPLDEATARQQLAAFDHIITSLEDAARSAMATPIAISDGEITEDDAPAFAAVTAAASEPAGDDLTMIKGVCADTARALCRLGFDTFEVIAAAKPEDVMLIKSELGAETRISKDNWIEQAAMLAAGVTTQHQRALADQAVTPSIADQPSDASAVAGIGSEDARADVPEPAHNVIRLDERRRVEQDLLASARESAAGIGRKMIYAASIVVLLVSLQTGPATFNSIMSTSQFEQLATCGRAVLKGDAACTGVTWSMASVLSSS